MSTYYDQPDDTYSPADDDATIASIEAYEAACVDGSITADDVTPDPDAVLVGLVAEVFHDYERKPEVVLGDLGNFAGKADPEAWRITLNSDAIAHNRIEVTLLHEAAHLLVPAKTGDDGSHTSAFFSVLRALCLAYLDESAAEDASRESWEYAVDSGGEW